MLLVILTEKIHLIGEEVEGIFQTRDRADNVHRGFGFGLHPADTIDEDVLRNGGMRKVIGALLTEWLEEVVEGFGKFLLDLYIADLAHTVTFLEVIHLGFRW